MKTLIFNPSQPQVSTTLYIGEGAIERLGSHKQVIIADESISRVYAQPLATARTCPLLTIPSGESSKTQERATALIHSLLELNVDRETTLVAIGGGVITDLVGFVASVYMRGIPLILIPTTLLAMVDAAIGGKTAIDTPFGKNLIGTTYPPKEIFIDLTILNTLPEVQWIHGLSEILKLGLVYNPALFSKERLTLITPAIETKLEICAKDPMEQGIRRILNFGHTIAHALEACSSYEISHGEAVLIGCLVESHLSMSLGLLSEGEFARIETLYRTLPFKLPRSYNRSLLLEAMAHDKKSASGKSRFVLIDAIGHALPCDGNYCQEISLAALTPTLQWMETTCL